MVMKSLQSNSLKNRKLKFVLANQSIAVHFGEERKVWAVQSAVLPNGKAHFGVTESATER